MSDCQRVRHTLVGADGKTHECEIVQQLRRELREQKRLNVTLAEKLADVAEKLARCLAGKDAETSATP